MGSGRSEMVRAIYGADKADSGVLKVKGKETKISSPLDADESRHGIFAGR